MVAITTESLNELIGRLVRLGDRLAAARTAADNPDGSVSPKLFAAHQQLGALIEFYEGDAGAECAPIAELKELWQALIDIAGGQRVDWLTPKYSAKNARLTMETAAYHGAYAAIMDRLMSHGMPERDAAEFVVSQGKLRTALGKGAGRSNNNWKIVKHWRERANGSTNQNLPDEQGAFRRMNERIEKEIANGAGVQQAALAMLKVLKKMMGDAKI